MKSAAPIALKNRRFKVLFFKNVNIKQLLREKKGKKAKECTAQSVAKTNLKSKSTGIQNNGERRILYIERLRLHRKMEIVRFNA